MRILHTSDWHLGKFFHRISLLDVQRAFIDHLEGVIESEKVDVLVIAGDVYDVPTPPQEAVKLFEQALERLSSHCHVFLISGNHDSATRLGFAGRLLERSRVHLRTKLDDIDRPLVIEDDHGKVAIYGLPYLRPTLDQRILAAGTDSVDAPVNHVNVTKLAVNKARSHAQLNNFDRTVLVAHAWFAGGEGSESELPLSVGGVENVPVSVVEDFGYVALGHLHGPQDLRNHVRYPGSPYPYSFGEATRARRTLLVDYTDKVEVRDIQVPVLHEVHVLAGTFEHLMNAPEHADKTEAFIKAVLQDPEPVHEAMTRLSVRFPNIVDVEQPNMRIDVAGRVTTPTKGRTDLEVCEDYVEFIRGTKPTEFEQEHFIAGLTYAQDKVHDDREAQLAQAASSEESEDDEQEQVD